MTDEQKLRIVKEVFKRYIRDIETLAALSTFINGITPTKVKNFLKAEIQEDIDTRSLGITNEQANVTDLTTLKGEIDTL